MSKTAEMELERKNLQVTKRGGQSFGSVLSWDAEATEIKYIWAQMEGVFPSFLLGFLISFCLCLN